MPETTQVVAPPLKLSGLHRAGGTEIGVGHRSITMLRPICKVCAPHTQNAPRGWWNDCTHEPYVGLKSVTTTKPVFGDGPNGSRIVVDEVTDTVKMPYPNFQKVPLTERINAGKMPEEKRRDHGFILPEELAGRSRAFPDGIANTCEFRNCFIQDGLKTYQFLDHHGNLHEARFCQKAEAVACYEDVSGTVVEVANAMVRSEQFSKSNAYVREVS